MLRTPICDLFGIEHPVLLAGMGGVSMAPLVAAVSNAGGLGVMGAANLSPDGLREEIRKTKALGCQLLLEALELLEQDRVVPLPNDRTQATYYSFPSRDVARRVRAARGALI